MKQKINYLFIILMIAILMPVASFAEFNIVDGKNIVEGNLISDNLLISELEAETINIQNSLTLPINSLSLSRLTIGNAQNGDIATVRNGELSLEAAPSGNSYSPASIDESIINNAAITTNKILNETIQTNDFANNSVDGSKLQDQSIIGSKIINGSITIDKIGSILNILLAGFPQNPQAGINSNSSILEGLSNLDLRSRNNLTELGNKANSSNPNFTGNIVINGDLNITADADVNGNTLTAASINGPIQSTNTADNLEKPGGPNSVLYQSANNQSSTVNSASYADNRILGMSSNGTPEWKSFRLATTPFNSIVTSQNGQTCNSLCRQVRGVCLKARCGGSLSFEAGRCGNFHNQCGGSTGASGFGPISCICVIGIAQ